MIRRDLFGYPARHSGRGICQGNSSVVFLQKKITSLNTFQGMNWAWAYHERF